jgi:hypothetical protein
MLFCKFACLLLLFCFFDTCFIRLEAGKRRKGRITLERGRSILGRHHPAQTPGTEAETETETEPEGL